MSSLRSLIENSALPAALSEFPKPDSLTSSILGEQLPVEELINCELPVQAICQKLSSAKSKALADLFYCRMLHLSLKPFQPRPCLISSAARSIDYLSSQSLIDPAKFRQKLVHKFTEAVSAAQSAEELIEYAKASKDIGDQTMKQIVEVNFKRLPWGSDFVEDTRMLSFCYELQDYSIDVAVLKSMLESHFKDHLILSENEDFLSELSDIRPHPQFSNFVSKVAIELGLSSQELDSNNLKKRNITFKGILYAYTFPNYKIEVRSALLNSAEVAIKIYKTSDQGIVDKFIKEVDTMERLSGNKGFVKVYGKYFDKPDFENEGQFELGVCMELCPKSLEKDIAQRTAQNNKYSSEYMINSVRDLFEGLLFMMEQERVLHRDIKPDNILVSRSGELKLIDFATVLEIEHSVSVAPSVVFNPVGTWNYLAPEERAAHEIGQEIKGRPEQGDVYSLGLTLLRMETLYPIIDMNLSRNQKELQRLIGKVREDWLKNLLVSMLQWDPKKRPPLKRLIGMLPNLPTLV